MELLSFTIAAGETKRFEIAGRYLEIIDSATQLDVYLTGVDGGRVSEMKNALSGFYVSNQFTAFEVKSAAAQTVQLMFTDGTGGSRRQPGIVSVVDGERQKVLQGVCMRGVGQQAGAAGAPIVQLFNPAASGKNLFVQEIRAGALNADAWGVKTTSTQLPLAFAGGAQNVDRSGPAPVGLMRGDSAGTAEASLFFYTSGYMQASSDVLIVLPRPILVRPGFGIDFYVNSAANTIRANFEWEEWPT